MEAKQNGPNGEHSSSVVPGPTNPMVTPLLTDLYQFTMAYAYWKAGKHNERAVLVTFLFLFVLQCCLFAGKYERGRFSIPYLYRLSNRKFFWLLFVVFLYCFNVFILFFFIFFIFSIDCDSVMLILSVCSLFLFFFLVCLCLYTRECLISKLSQVVKVNLYFYY